MKEGGRKEGGLWQMCDLKKMGIRSDNVEGNNLLMHFSSNFCSVFESSDFFKPFGISPIAFHIL